MQATRDSRIHKEPLQINKDKMDNPVERWAKLEDHKAEYANCQHIVNLIVCLLSEKYTL